MEQDKLVQEGLIVMVREKPLLTAKGIAYVLENSEQVDHFAHGYDEKFYGILKFKDEDMPHSVNVGSKIMVSEIQKFSLHTKEFIEENLIELGKVYVLRKLFSFKSVKARIGPEINKILGK